jgi:hypothetical protein
MLDLPRGFIAYFETRFPRLLLRGVEVACRFLSEEKDFSALCRVIAPIFKASAATIPAAPLPLSPSLYSNPSPFIPASMLSIPPLNASIDYSSVIPSNTANAINKLVTPSDSPVLTHPDGINVNKDKDAIAASVTSQVVVWHGGALAVSVGCRGWWRRVDDQSDLWSTGGGKGSSGRPRPMHLVRASTDLKYRTRLCTHWEQTVTCPMRKKG